MYAPLPPMANSHRDTTHLTSNEENDDRMMISDEWGTFPSPNPGSSTNKDEVAILEAQDLANACDTRYRRATFSSEDEDEDEKEEQEDEEEEDIDAVRCGRTRRLESQRRLDFKLGGEIMSAGVGRRRRGSSTEQKTAAASANRDGMEEEMAGLSQSDLEFFKILLPGMYEESLRLPDKFVRQLGDRRVLKLQLAGAGMCLWNADVFTDEKSGDVYLAQGWKEFTHAHDLRVGYVLFFRYYSCTATLAMTVFDHSTCRKQ